MRLFVTVWLTLSLVLTCAAELQTRRTFSLVSSDHAQLHLLHRRGGLRDFWDAIFNRQPLDPASALEKTARLAEKQRLATQAKLLNKAWKELMEEKRSELDQISLEKDWHNYAANMGKKLEEYTLTNAELEESETLAQGSRRGDFLVTLREIEVAATDSGHSGEPVENMRQKLKYMMSDAEWNRIQNWLERKEEQRVQLTVIEEGLSEFRAKDTFRSSETGVSLGDHNRLNPAGSKSVLIDATGEIKVVSYEAHVKVIGYGLAATLLLGAGFLCLALAGYIQVSGITPGRRNNMQQHLFAATELTSDAMEIERCREMNFAAAEAEGVAQQFLGSLTKWNETVTALKPLYHRAYLQATVSQINNISSTNITNWGPSAPLPVALPTVGLSGEEKLEAERKNEDANRQWEAKEFFRPMHLQHQLVGEYHDAVHESALNLMTQAIDLPYPAESEQFTIAYSSLYLRMAISPECKPHINEGGHITHWLEDSRNKQADRQLLLNGFARQHFAARSRMDPTLPAPAP